MAKRREIPALRVKQWLDVWNDVKFSAAHMRRKPDEHFYIFSIKASVLKRLSGIQRREASAQRATDPELGIQRQHDRKRSDEISLFVRYGYPLSELRARGTDNSAYKELQKPGWLPTSIVINILKQEDNRHGRKVKAEDLVTISQNREGLSTLSFPADAEKKVWEPSNLHPIEVVDGQHRLWAFDDKNLENEDYEIPVVAFLGLDISWQAYLFWTINIKPKRINASLAYDLFPLLRNEDWLNKVNGPLVYRETRAQEITEMLWMHNNSPWHEHINLLGLTGLDEKMVTQAAWIRSLLTSFIKPWEGTSKLPGGLFGAKFGNEKAELAWNSAQQSALIIFLGERLKKYVRQEKLTWASSLRLKKDKNSKKDAAFYGTQTLINTDQGVRALLQVINDLLYVHADKMGLFEWVPSASWSSELTVEDVATALDALKRRTFASDLDELMSCLAKYDWRTSSAPGLTEQQQREKAALRGSGGYKLLREDLLKLVAKSQSAFSGGAKLLEKVYAKTI